mgnify:CR=1 FL=1
MVEGVVEVGEVAGVVVEEVMAEAEVRYCFTDCITFR